MKTAFKFFIISSVLFLYACASSQAKKTSPSEKTKTQAEQKRTAEQQNIERTNVAGSDAELDASWGLGTDSLTTQIGEKQVREFSLHPLGYSWKTTDTLWHNWESIAAINQDAADLMLVNRSEELGFFIYSALIDMNFLNAEDVFKALLMRHGISPDTQNLTVKKSTIDGNAVWNFDIVFLAGSFDFNYKGKFFFGNGRAVMSIAWTQGILYKKFEREMERAVQGLKLEKAFDKNAREKQKFSARVVNQIGLLRILEDKPIEALSYFERANTMDKNDTLYLVNCGFVYQLRHLYGPGIAHFESQMDLVRQSGKLLFILSAMHKSLYNFKKTKEYAELALEKMPEDEEANVNLSDALWGLGQRAASFEIAQKLYDKNPSERMGIYTARTLMGLHRYNEAVDLLMDVKKQFGTSSKLALNCVEALLFLNRYEEALLISEEALAKDKKNADLLLSKGKALFYLRNYKGAEQALNQSLTANSEKEETRSYLSASKAFLGKADMKAIQKAIEPADPKPANLKALVVDTLSREYPVVAHYSQETVKITPNMPWVITEQRLLQVLNSSGVQLFSEFKIDFLPGMDRVYINALDVYDSAFKFKYSWNPKNSYITYATANARENEAQTAHLPLQLQPGDFIYFQASRTAIKADGSIPYTHYKSSREYPVGKSVFRVYADTTKILYDEYGDLERRGLSNGIEWKTENPVVIHKEPYMPTYRDFGSGVILAAKKLWGEEGRMYQNLIHHQYKNSIPVREQAFEAAGTKNKLNAIYAISDWVRKSVKYTERGFGGHSLIPKQSLATLQEKQGDCKDQSLLLQEMLATIGVKSHLALIHLEEIGSEALTSIQQFNHQILYVPATKDNPELWIDPSDKVSSRRPIPLDLEGRVALVINGDSSFSTITPILEINQEHEAFLHHRLRIDAQGVGHFRDSLIFTGKFASTIRNELLQRDEKERSDYFAKWISQSLEASELVAFISQNTDDFSKPLILTIVYNSPQFNPYPALWERSLMRLPPVKERRHPIRIPHETKFYYSLSVNSSKGKFSLEPETAKPRNTFVEMKILDGGKKCVSDACSLKLEWRTDAVFADPSEYEAVKQEWDAALRMASPKIKMP
jgi:tetratricopeptide (TPR) repeat protein